MATPKEYEMKVEDLEIYMLLILERYKNAMVNYGAIGTPVKPPSITNIQPSTAKASCISCDNATIVKNLGAQYNNQVNQICTTRNSPQQCAQAGGDWGTPPLYKGMCVAEGGTGFIKDFFDGTGSRKLPPSVCEAKCKATEGCKFYSSRMNDMGGCMLFSSCDNPTTTGGAAAYDTWGIASGSSGTCTQPTGWTTYNSDVRQQENGWSRMGSAVVPGKPPCSSGYFWGAGQGSCEFASCPSGYNASNSDGDGPGYKNPDRMPHCPCKITTGLASEEEAAQANAAAEQAKYVEETIEAKDAAGAMEAMKIKLDVGYGKIFLLQNAVDSNITSLNSEIENINENVNKIMKNYKKEMHILNEKKASDLASVPLEEQINIQAIERFVYLGYYSLAIMAGGFFLYKHK